MGTLIKILAILVPMIIVCGSIFLIIQAANFWIEVMSPAKVYPIELGTTKPFAIRVFVPEKIRPEDPPQLEVEIKLLDNFDKEIEVRVNLIPQCDYLKANEPSLMLKFGSQQPLVKSVGFKLEVRNITPPPDCAVTIEVFQGNAPNPFASTIFRIIIDAWTGHLLAIIKLLLGIVGMLAGLRGLVPR